MPSRESIDDAKHWHDRANEIPSGERQDHLLFLDLIRWVSALAVVAYHLRDLIFVPLAQLTAAPLWLRAFYFVTALGHEAVMVFFVLSGYLVGGALVSRPISSLHLGAEYFIARFARIYPVVLPALAITFLVGIELPHWLAAAPILSGRHWGESLGYDFRERLSLWTVACNSLMLQNTACMPLGDNGPLWSLSCEWFYYMSFPLALWLLRCRPRVLALAAMTSLFAIAAWEFPVAAQYYPIWLFGIAARFAGERLPMGRSSLFAFALALAASLTIEYLNVLPQTTGDMAVGAATAGMLSCRAVRSLRLARLHGRLAGFSYSLYVVHFPIATALIGAWQQLAHVQHRSTPGPVAFLVFSATLLGCYLAAFAIAQFTERRAGDFRRALSGILIGLHLTEPSSLVAHSGRLSAVVTRPLRGNTPRGDRFRGLRNLLAIDPLASGGLERARRAQHSGRQSIPGHNGFRHFTPLFENDPRTTLRTGDLHHAEVVLATLRSRSGRLAENLLKSNACRQRLRLPRDHMPSFMEGQSGSPGRARERPR